MEYLFAAGLVAGWGAWLYTLERRVSRLEQAGNVRISLDPGEKVTVCRGLKIE